MLTKDTLTGATHTKKPKDTLQELKERKASEREEDHEEGSARDSQGYSPPTRLD
jgi:hypothetical protein